VYGMKKCTLRVWNEGMRGARVEFMNAWCVSGMQEYIVRVWNEGMRGARVE
jgi:hypothetical protein